jgi:hypothetical protein
MQDAADELVTDMMRKYNAHCTVSLGSFGLFEKLHEVAKGKGLLLNEVSSWRLRKRTLRLKKGYPTNLCIQRGYRC